MDTELGGLTNKRLFEGQDLTETLASVLKDRPDLSAAPACLWRLLERCLEKDPMKRPTAPHLASYAGLVPRVHSSGGTRAWGSSEERFSGDAVPDPWDLSL